MRQWWQEKGKEEISAERYDPQKHDGVFEKKLSINGCTMSSLMEIPSRRITYLRLQNIKFTGSVDDLNFPELQHIVFDNCVFDKSLSLDFYEGISVTFKRCINLKDNILLYVHEAKKLEFNNCAFKFAEIQMGHCEELKIHSTYFNQFFISPLNQKIHLKPPKSGVIGTGYLSFYVVDAATIMPGLEFNNFNFVFEDFIDSDDKTQHPGELNILGGDFIEGIQIGSKTTEINLRQKVEESPFIRKVNIQHGRLKTDHINITNCNLRELRLTGKNTSVSNYFIDCIVQNILFETYEQSETGLVNFRGLVNPLGELNAKSALILNDRLFFQDSDMSKWSPSISGSLLTHHALNCKMPEKPNPILTILQQLEVQNTWLNNSDKESDVINYNDLKKEQWKLVWEKRKEEGKINFGEKIQRFAQWTNDYGTDWLGALSLYVLFNIAISVIVSLIVVNENSMFYPIEFIAVSLKEFGYLIYPLTKPSLHNWSDGAVPFLIIIKAINATLIFQFISAFRVYFKK